MSKEQERADLHRIIWSIAEDLRNKVSGWEFKSYVLGMLFYRFISENITDYLNEMMHKLGQIDFDYTKLDDSIAENARTTTTEEKGFFILPSQLFTNVRANAKNDKDLNETLSNVFNAIEKSAKGTASEQNFSGLFDDIDLNNTTSLGDTVTKRNEKLAKILDKIGSLPLGNFQDNTIDVFGDAYEYLIKMYASNAGKSGGEFFTPQEVSELLAKITTVGKTEVNKVYDPCCGSGSLLLKFAKILGKDNVRIGFFGQESEPTTYNLCRINMFLHNIDFNKFNIALGDTLLDPKYGEYEPFDCIVSNPPYSIPWVGDDDITLINDPRFAPAAVLAPKQRSDLAFTMHMLSWLSTDGIAAIVEYPGVLTRGGAEAKIRKYLIDNNFVDTIIQLPINLFFGTTTPTCIIVLKKSKPKNDICFIDGSNEFVHEGNKNKLTDDNITNILNAFINRVDKEHFCKIVKNEEIIANDCNLAVSTYVKYEEKYEEIDISQINLDIADIVTKQQTLRTEIDNFLADLEK